MSTPSLRHPPERKCYEVWEADLILGKAGSFIYFPPRVGWMS